MKDIRGCEAPFGGIPIILGGDFVQILPVVKTGNRAATVAASLQNSSLWRHFTILHLRQNMRVRIGERNRAFANWIQSLSWDRNLQNVRVPLPTYIRTTTSDINLYDRIYPRETMAMLQNYAQFFYNRTIIATHNNSVVDINNIILQRMPGVTHTYESVDSIDRYEDNESHTDIPVEFLRSQNPSSLPPAQLKLKIGAPIMLLRNLFPKEGLCNGTRMIITNLRSHTIETTILGGHFHGQPCCIPRITLTQNIEEGGWIHHRKQLPIRLCFAMTINKAQGQSLDIVGIDLRKPPFTHGQFYVAISRVTDVNNLDILLPKQNDGCVHNIEFPEGLEDLRLL